MPVSWLSRNLASSSANRHGVSFVLLRVAGIDQSGGRLKRGLSETKVLGPEPALGDVSETFKALLTISKNLII